MISFLKLILEDFVQLVIQIMFYIFLIGGDFYGFLLLSIGFSALSAFSWISEISSDSKVKLSLVGINKLLRKFYLIRVVLTHSIEKYKYSQNINNAFRKNGEKIEIEGLEFMQFVIN